MNINERENQNGSLALGCTWQTLAFAFHPSSPVNYTRVIPGVLFVFCPPPPPDLLTRADGRERPESRQNSEEKKVGYWVEYRLLKMFPSVRLSDFPCCLHLSCPSLKPFLLLREARRLPMRGAHELPAKLLCMTYLLMLQLTGLDVHTCTSRPPLCWCCVTIPLILGKLALFIIYQRHGARPMIPAVIDGTHLQFLCIFLSISYPD